METENFSKKYLSNKQKMLFSFLLSSFWVLFMWGFFERGVYVFGLNAFLFLAGILCLFLYSLYLKKGTLKEDVFWILPISLIALSFLLYENPFLKFISTLIVFPFSFAFFYNFSFLEDGKKKHWDSIFTSALLNRVFSFLLKLKESADLYLGYLFPEGKKKSLVIKRIFFGSLLFLLISLGVVIPLLSSADAVFGDKVEFIYEWLQDVVSPVLVYKLLFLFAMSLLILSSLLSWSRQFSIKDLEKREEKKLDPIVSGIVIGGISLIYLLFLWVQTERLFVGELPFDFKEAVSFVKSGFWQLFFLSLLNILIYTSSYKRTNNTVQKILFGFIITSLLLLFSAGQRMLLYVKYYGFSYEKFFALYTVIFCAILFFWLIFGFFSEKKKNIIKFLAILFLWMYSIMTIFPVEQFIFRTNVQLKNNVENSHIKLSELRMLSSDVLYLARIYREDGILHEYIKPIPGQPESIAQSQNQYWDDWLKNREASIHKKAWYELNASNILYLIKNKD